MTEYACHSQAWEIDSGRQADVSDHEEEVLRSKEYASLSEFYLRYDVLDKALNKGMTVEQILSGMESSGKPLRIFMPLSSLSEYGEGRRRGRSSKPGV